MEVQNRGVGQPGASGVNRTDSRPARSEKAASASEDGSSHVPSAELKSLLKDLRDIPEVRPEKLADAAAKIASGYYLTPEAASKTAEAILRSGD